MRYATRPQAEPDAPATRAPTFDPAHARLLDAGGPSERLLYAAHADSTPALVPYGAATASSPGLDARPSAARHNSGFTAVSGAEEYGGVTGTKRRTMRLRSSQAVPHGWSSIRTPNQLAYLGVIAVQAIVVGALIITVYARYRNALVAETVRLRFVTVCLSIFIIAEVFAVCVTLDALRVKNTSASVRCGAS